jgi:competence protein ComGC
LPIRKAQGFALIDLIFVCGIIGLLASIALPRLMLAKQSASSASAVGSMRVIDSAQLTYALTCGSGFYAPNLVTLGTAPPASNEAFIGVGARRLGHRDQERLYDHDERGGAIRRAQFVQRQPRRWEWRGGRSAATADPIELNNLRFFGTNASGVIYEHNSTLVGSMPESGPPPVGQMIVH